MTRDRLLEGVYGNRHPECCLLAFLVVIAQVGICKCGPA